MKIDSIKLDKMPTLLGSDEVEYFLPTGNNDISLNALLDKEIEIHFTGTIRCISCDTKISKTYGQGFCYACFSESADNSECILRPELCQAHLGKGRDPEWEKRNHLQPHTVYFSYTSEIKVGVTRDTQVPYRWIDQGAELALIIAQVPYRQLAGRIEVALKNHYADKTNWRKMLSEAQFDPLILENEINTLSEKLPTELQRYISKDQKSLLIKYPILHYPHKIQSLNLNEIPDFKNKLIGIKGQYLIFENGYVINIRSYSGYIVDLNFHS